MHRTNEIRDDTIRHAMEEWENLDTPGKRLEWARQHRGFRNKSDFAKHYGFTETTYRSHENGNRGLDEAMARQYADKLKIRWVWLLTGDGLPVDVASALAPEGSQVQGPPNGSTPDVAAQVMRALREPQRPKIPIINYIQAGGWATIIDDFAPGDGDSFLSSSLDFSSDTFALTIRGESMLDKFSPGDHVIIDPNITPLPGDFVVAKLDGDEDATFKKFRPRGTDAQGNEIFDLVPLNDDWPTIHINADNPGRVVGTMIEHREYRRR